MFVYEPKTAEKLAEECRIHKEACAEIERQRIAEMDGRSYLYTTEAVDYLAIRYGLRKAEARRILAARRETVARTVVIQRGYRDLGGARCHAGKAAYRFPMDAVRQIGEEHGHSGAA